MTIWILAILLFAAFAAAGFFQGAIRAAISLVGLFCAAFLALPLSRFVYGLFPLVGVKDPIWLWLLPPLLVFVVISIVFLIIALVAHKQIEVKFGHKFEELRSLRWKRLNRRLGTCVGILTGAVYLVVLGIIISFLGYFTVQVAAADETDPVPLKVLNRARLDLRQSGLEKTLTVFAQPPGPYYDLADSLALVYHNPDLRRRVATYPGLLSFGQRTEFQELGNDVDFNNLIATRGSVWALLHHPKVQEILQNGEIVQNLKATVASDISDFKEYAQTGQSRKYGEEKILGRWEFDPNASMINVRKKHPNLSARELTLIKARMNAVANGHIIAMPDNRIVIRVDINPDALKAAMAGPTAAIVVPQAQAQAVPGPGPGMSAEMRQRYGQRTGGTAPQAPAPAVPQIVQSTAANPPANPLQDVKISGQGTWEKAGEKYQIKFQNEDGKEYNVEAAIDDDTLVLSRSGDPVGMVYYKAE